MPGVVSLPQAKHSGVYFPVQTLKTIESQRGEAKCSDGQITGPSSRFMQKLKHMSENRHILLESVQNKHWKLEHCQVCSSSPLQPTPVFSSPLQSILFCSSLFQSAPVLSSPLKSTLVLSSLLVFSSPHQSSQFTPVHSSPLKSAAVLSSSLQSIPVCSSPLQSSPVSSSLLESAQILPSLN